MRNIVHDPMDIDQLRSVLPRFGASSLSASSMLLQSTSGSCSCVFHRAERERRRRGSSGGSSPLP